MKKILGISFLAVVLFSSCKKDEATPTCTLSAASILGTYKTTGATTQANAQAPIVDDYATWDACEKDDLVTFSAGGVFTTSEGVTSCTPPTDPFTGNWALSGNTLTFSFMGFSSSATITDFTCNGFKIKTVDSSTGEITISTVTKQ